MHRSRWSRTATTRTARHDRRYVQANPVNALATGLAARDLQFHDRADLYTWQGDAAAVALWLAPFLGQASSFPAVIATAHGDGRAVIYTFDLAASTVRFHQGRPEQASTGAYPDYDSDGMYKANDLFVGCLDDSAARPPTGRSAPGPVRARTPTTARCRLRVTSRPAPPGSTTGAGRVPDWRRCAGGCGTSSPPSSGATGAAR